MKHSIILLLLGVLWIGTARAQAPSETPSITNYVYLYNKHSNPPLFEGEQGRLRYGLLQVVDYNQFTDLPALVNIDVWAYLLNASPNVTNCAAMTSYFRFDSQTDRFTYEDIPTTGESAIATSMEAAGAAFPPDQRTIMTVFSATEDQCGGDPCAVAATLAAQGIEVNTIGIYPSEEARHQLECIAQAGHGHYAEATDYDVKFAAERRFKDLVVGTLQVTAPNGSPIYEPITLLDVTTGEEVYSGRNQIDLPVGTYDVLVPDSVDNLHWQNVVIEANMVTKLGEVEASPLQIMESTGGPATISYEASFFRSESDSFDAYASSDSPQVKLRAGVYSIVIDIGPIGGYGGGIDITEIFSDVEVTPGEPIIVTLSPVGGLEVWEQDHLFEGLVQLKLAGSAYDNLDSRDEAFLLQRIPVGVYEVRTSTELFEDVEIKAGQTTKLTIKPVTTFETFRQVIRYEIMISFAVVMVIVLLGCILLRNEFGLTS